MADSPVNGSLVRSVEVQLSAYTNVQAIILTAHPDDELLFFGPLLQHLNRLGTPILVLCLTNGGWRRQRLRGHTGGVQDEALGALRVRELMSLERRFPAIRVRYLHTPLLDNPREPWDQAVLRCVLHTVDSVFGSRVTLYTFDARGVTGHINHCQLGREIATFRLHGLRARCFQLRTPPPLSWMVPRLYRPEDGDTEVVAESPKQLRAIFMEAYKSQRTWFRPLQLHLLPLVNRVLLTEVA